MITKDEFFVTSLFETRIIGFYFSFFLFESVELLRLSNDLFYEILAFWVKWAAYGKA